MSKERIAIFGVAIAFYIVGGWSLYGQFLRHEAGAKHKWLRTDEAVRQAYLNDAVEHGLASEPVLGYRYITRDIRHDLQQPRPRFLTRAAKASRPEYQPEDPAVAVMVGDTNYSVGFGLIGFGTLLALTRELIQRRRGKRPYFQINRW